MTAVGRFRWQPVARPLDAAEPQDDRGSVTPLIIGMLVCLLVLTAGVTAAGSAFLAGQRLQGLCDGAVAAAVAGPRRPAPRDLHEAITAIRQAGGAH